MLLSLPAAMPAKLIDIEPRELTARRRCGRMAIVTVTGIIEKEEAGIVLPHEHVFIDLTNQYRQFPEATPALC